MSAASPMPKDDRHHNVVHLSPSARHDFLQHLNRLAKIEREVISDLEHQTDDEVLETRSRAHLLGKTAWRIEAACDAEIWGRAEDKRKAQNKATDVDSIKKAVKRHSDMIGCTPQTVYTNRRVATLMREAQIKSTFDLDVLDQKGFFIAALSAVDPVTALETFASKKAADSKFKVADAFRLLEKTGSTVASATTAAIQSARQAAGCLQERLNLISHITASRKMIVKQILPSCPEPNFRQSVWNPLLLDLDNALRELFDGDAGEAIKKSWLHGNHREDQLAKATGFPMEVVQRILNYLSDDFILVPRAGEYRTWHLVGQPLPPELRRR